jgi:hypothetical protein
MMSYQAGLQGQMMQQQPQNQYMTNHKPPVMPQQQGIFVRISPMHAYLRLFCSHVLLTFISSDEVIQC